jgi:inner membrane protease subunit 2
MQPTFNPTHASAPLHHDVVLLDRWSVALNTYSRGDVVTLWYVSTESIRTLIWSDGTSTSRSPQNPKLLTTKRIIALEGDLVSDRPETSRRSEHR